MASKKSSINGKPRSLPEQTRRFWSNFVPEDRVLVVINADPDALASALALRRLLWRRVANVTFARINEISRPDNLAMVRLLKISTVPLGQVDRNDFSKLVMVDGQPQHSPEFPQTHYTAIIDHHPPGESLAQMADFIDVRPKYGATSTILTEYLRGAKIKPSARLSTALVYGIKTDTSVFQRPALQEDLNAFRYLFPKVNQSVLRKIEFSEMRIKDLDILRKALERRVVRKGLLFAHMGQVNSPDVLVQIADFFFKVDSVDLSVVSGAYNDRLVVIMRNMAKRSNAGKHMMQAFGSLGAAGGHKTMARAEMQLAILKEVLGDLKDETIGHFVLRRIQRPWVKIKNLPDYVPLPTSDQAKPDKSEKSDKADKANKADKLDQSDKS
jgi:nanoRNase/pAp phosphatase (c-di-AMP/oligoRNAs hydrolase)